MDRESGAKRSPSPAPAAAVLNKSELIAQIIAKQPELESKAVEEAVNSIIERMAAALVFGERIEIRGFGSISLHYRPPRTGRNPKTGELVQVAEKYAVHFRPGELLRQRVNQT